MPPKVKELNPRQTKALRVIHNHIVRKGEAPSVRELAKALGYRSPRSAAVLIEQLVLNKYATRRLSGGLQLLRLPPKTPDHAVTVAVPLVGSAPCGKPFLASENVEAVVAVSDQLARPPHQYFLLRAVGDSMTQAGIAENSLVLVRKKSTAENGEIVVALIDDEATIKVFQRSANAISLMPSSHNPKHKPIIVTRDFSVQGVVVTSL